MSSVCQMMTGDGQRDASRTCVSGNVFILKVFLICRDEKWESGVVKTPGRSRRLFWRAGNCVGIISEYGGQKLSEATTKRDGY
ncbi:hypothetical protein HCW87_02150 [Escherichia coli]|nr:hypothetical protein [Escherichia coli]